MKNLHVHVHVCHAQVTSTVFRTKPFFCYGGFLHMNIEYDRHHGMCVKIEIFINFSQKYRWSKIVIFQQNICT